MVIVDYGLGNLGSIHNILKKIGAPSSISSDHRAIASASKLILPGVGHFDRAMERLEQLALRPLLDEKVLGEKVPVLGICLGMQLLTRRSEEGSRPGLGWIRGETKRFSFPSGSALKVPHMGWNDVQRTGHCALTDDFVGDERFYFVHSYYVAADEANDCILRAQHGVEFAAAVRHENIYGVQFHPEKSHRFGMKLFANFAKL